VKVTSINRKHNFKIPDKSHQVHKCYTVASRPTNKQVLFHPSPAVPYFKARSQYWLLTTIKLNVFIGDFPLPPQCSCGPRSSGMLRNVGW